MSPRHGGCPCNSRQPHQFPFLSRAPACAAESPKLSLPGAAPGRLANFHFGVVADKQCTCPASKLMWERYPPTPPAFAHRYGAGEGCRVGAQSAKTDFVYSISGLRLGRPISILRETRPRHREKPHKLLQVGVTPTPATTARAGPPREVIRLPDCKSGVVKRSWK